MEFNLLFLSIFNLLFFCVKGFIIPEEIPSLLSLIYSNIPPIKKGTDSRVGVGFRLGEHADFQILVELGPQQATQPLQDLDSDRRRHIILQSASNGDYGPVSKYIAKFNLTKMKSGEPTNINRTDKDENSVNVSNNDWLVKWSEQIKKMQQNELMSKKFGKF